MRNYRKLNMNHGSNNNNKELDSIVDKLNHKIGRLLGKKNTKNAKSFNQPTSNKMFIVVMMLTLFLLWGSTGFYYLAENQAGIILTNGRISQVANGIKVGFTLPYPFGDIEFISTAPTGFIQAEINDTQDYYETYSQDLQMVRIKAKFSYKVTNPKLFYLTVLQNNNDLDDMIKYDLWQQFHLYMAQNSQKQIASKNLTVMATEIKESTNDYLKILGLGVVKLQIDTLHYPSSNDIVPLTNNREEESAVVTTPAVAQKLLDEASRYSLDTATATKLNIEEFNQLLPQYKENPEGIAMQMYYNMLEKVPLKKDDEYALLNANLSTLLLTLPQTITTYLGNSAMRQRNVDRSVKRERNLNGF